MIINPSYDVLVALVPKVKEYINNTANRAKWDELQQTWNSTTNYKYGPEYGNKILETHKFALYTNIPGKPSLNGPSQDGS